MRTEWDVIVVGSGNAALCAAIAPGKGSSVLVIEKASQDMAGGNSKYTAGAMRFVYNTADELTPLLADPQDLGCPIPTSAATRRRNLG